MSDTYNGQGYLVGGPSAIVPYQPSMPGMTSAGGKGLLAILRRGWWLILLSLILAGGGAFGYLQVVKMAEAGRLAGRIPERYLDFIKPRYQSTARILVEKHVSTEDLATPKAPGSGVRNFLEMQAVLLNSPDVLNEAMGDPNVLALASLREEAHIQKLIGTLDAKVGRNNDVLYLTASSAEPNETAAIVNAVVRSYIRWHKRTGVSSANEMHDSLMRKLDKARDELGEKRREKLLFEEREPALIEGGIHAQTLELLRQDLVAARVAAREAESYHRGLQGLQSDPNKFRQYVQASQQMGVSSIAERRSLIEADLLAVCRELEEITTGVVSATKKKNSLLEKRKVELGEQLARLDDEFMQNELSLAGIRREAASSEEKQLEELYNSQSTEIQNIIGRNSAYVTLKAECELLEDLCKTFLKQINEVDLNSQRQLTIHPIQWATPATEPASPQAARVLGIALAMGIMAGGGLAFVRDWRDKRVRSADEVVEILGTPVLGAIPKTPRRQRIDRGGRVCFDSNSHVSEAYRTLRTTLLLGRSPESGRTLLVTSPRPHEGKTTLVNNLGAAMARAGQKTLIVDADLHKSMQRQILVRNKTGRGLTDLLTGEASLDDVIQATDINGLDVLAVGQNAASLPGLLNGGTLARVLEKLGEQYDRVLVDSAPVGIVSDALVLANLCDVTLLVLRANRSSRVDVQEARDALMTVGASLLGAVMNDVGRRDHRYRRYIGSHAYGGGNGKRKGSAIARMQPPADTEQDNKGERPLELWVDRLLGTDGPDSQAGARTPAKPESVQETPKRPDSS